MSKALTLASAHCRRRSLPTARHRHGIPAPATLTVAERPRDLTASAIMPAATAEVAHATLAGCHRRRRCFGDCANRRSNPDGISEPDRHGFRSAFTPWLSASDSETADAARGAATKSGGWRTSKTLSCSSKPLVDEPGALRASLGSLSTATTCKLRGRTNERGVLCRARNALSRRHWRSGGVSNPPVPRRLPSRGRPGGLLTPRCRCRKPSSKR